MRSSTPVAQQSSDRPATYDSFANLRRAEAERTVVNWRGTRDLDELVYGKRRALRDGDEG